MLRPRYSGHTSGYNQQGQEGKSTMWVYQEPEKNAIVDAAVLVLPEKYLSVSEQKSSREEQGQGNAAEPSESDTAAVKTQNDLSRRRLSLPSRDCILLAAAYLFGTLLAGVLRALCDTAEQETLSYYLDCWQDIFAASTPAQAIDLFVAELAVVIGAAAIVLLLGLSAIGPLPIFLFAMLYGAGSGLIPAQLLAGMTGTQKILFFLSASLPTALAAGALCLFGASALQVSSRIHDFSFGQGRNAGCHTAGARLLLGQFALLTVSLGPLCGAAAGLVCLINRLMQAG